MDQDHHVIGTIESRCSAVLAEDNNKSQNNRKRKRGRPRGNTKKIDRTIRVPLAVGRQTRMSKKVAECLQKCVENVDQLRKKKDELAKQIEECNDSIEVQHKRAAHAAAAISIHMVDSLKTVRSQKARHEHAKRHPRNKRRRKVYVPYTRMQLRNALESLVEGHKTTHTTEQAKRVATSVRRTARIYMDGKHVTLGRILKKHDVIAKIKTLSRYVTYA